MERKPTGWNAQMRILSSVRLFLYLTYMRYIFLFIVTIGYTPLNLRFSHRKGTGRQHFHFDSEGQKQPELRRVCSRNSGGHS